MMVKKKSIANNKKIIIEACLVGLIIVIIVMGLIVRTNKNTENMQRNNDDNVNNIDNSTNSVDNSSKNSNDDEDSLDNTSACQVNGCEYINSDSDLDNYRKLDTINKTEEYSRYLADESANVGFGIDNKYKDISSVAGEDLFQLLDISLISKSKGIISCYDRNYVKQKIYDLYGVDIGDIKVKHVSNYYCGTIGGGASSYVFESKDYKVDNDTYTWTYSYKSEEEKSTLKVITIFDFDNESKLFKLKSLSAEKKTL